MKTVSKRAAAAAAVRAGLQEVTLPQLLLRPAKNESQSQSESSTPPLPPPLATAVVDDEPNKQASSRLSAGLNDSVTQFEQLAITSVAESALLFALLFVTVYELCWCLFLCFSISALLKPTC